MKATRTSSLAQLGALLLLAVFLQGCIAIPPLINVNHRDEGFKEVQQRLQSIEHRLDEMEKKLDRQQ